MNTEPVRRWTHWAWKGLRSTWPVHRSAILSGCAAAAVATVLTIILSCYPAHPRRDLSPDTPLVRARLASGTTTLRVSANSTGTWSVRETGRKILGGTGPWKVEAWSGGIRIGGRTVFGSSLVLSAPESGFTLGDSTYPGRLVVRRGKSGLTAVNTLSIERYLRGVVPSEMPALWPQDALAAQAVAARTFVLHKIRRNRGEPWNLEALDLAYTGTTRVHPAATRAIRQTEGMALTYEGDVFKAYFHSTCGGHTAPADKVFGDTDIPPMQGVPCKWCRDSSYYSWQARMSSSKLASGLSSFGIEKVSTIRAQGRGEDGHARAIRVNGKKINANRFRLAVGAQKLRSTNFTVEKRGGAFVFSGHGWGHGVGMCQWGAQGLARSGKGWRQILQHYYPGSSLRKVY